MQGCESKTSVNRKVRGDGGLVHVESMSLTTPPRQQNARVSCGAQATSATPNSAASILIPPPSF